MSLARPGAVCTVQQTSVCNLLGALGARSGLLQWCLTFYRTLTSFSAHLAAN